MFNTVDYLCCRDIVFKVTKSGDSIKLYERVDNENYKIKRILKRGKNLSVINYNTNNVQEVSNNPILENIDDFKVHKKDNLIYLEIIKGGESYIKCI